MGRPERAMEFCAAAIRAIEHTIAQGWQGIREPETSANGTRGDFLNSTARPINGSRADFTAAGYRRG